MLLYLFLGHLICFFIKNSLKFIKIDVKRHFKAVEVHLMSLLMFLYLFLSHLIRFFIKNSLKINGVKNGGKGVVKKIKNTLRSQ